MNNELITQISWWQRKRTWVVILTFTVAAAAFIYLINNNDMGQFGRAYADMPLFENAVKHAQNNTEVVTAIGVIESVNKLTIAEGNVNYIADSVSATVTIKGTKAKAKLDIAALKVNGQWAYKLIKVRIKGLKPDIIVLKD